MESIIIYIIDFSNPSYKYLCPLIFLISNLAHSVFVMLILPDCDKMNAIFFWYVSSVKIMFGLIKPFLDRF